MTPPPDPKDTHINADRTPPASLLAAWPGITNAQRLANINQCPICDAPTPAGDNRDTRPFEAHLFDAHSRDELITLFTTLKDNLEEAISFVKPLIEGRNT